MCIYLDASSTCYTLGMKLSGFTKLTVITNGINPVSYTHLIVFYEKADILLQSRSSEATNIGYQFSSRAVFGWILFELNSGCEDLRERAEVFCLLSEYCR